MQALPTVFIHTNPKQAVGAIVAEHSLRRNSKHPDRFAVEILSTENYPWMNDFEGKTYTFGGSPRVWRNDDLQSFTPLRFAPPERMGYAGRAIVVDPDVFAAGDVNELFDLDMQGKAILCRRRPPKKHRPGYLATSVMLLDCAKLPHWSVRRDFAEMFSGQRDYKRWIQLELEDPETVGLFAPEWNDFDHLTPQTKLLHTTRRRTQPWKTGLPVDFRIHTPLYGLVPQSAVRWLRGWIPSLDVYKPHPDPAIERFFFTLLRECLEAGKLDEARLRDEIARGHVRADAFDVLDRLGPSDARTSLVA